MLILYEESGSGRFKQREAIFGADEAGIATLSFANVKMSQGYASAIVKYCRANGVGLVIFDSLTRFHAAQENASQEMSEVLSYFHLIAKAGIAVLIIHHDPKSGYERPDSSNTLRGSGDILAISDVHIVLQKVKNTSNRIAVKQLKNRDGEPMDDIELVVMNDVNRTRLWFEYVGVAPKRKSKDELADEAILKLMADGTARIQGEIVTALKGIASEKVVRVRLTALVEQGQLSLDIRASNSHKYQLIMEQTNE